MDDAYPIIEYLAGCGEGPKEHVRGMIRSVVTVQALRTLREELSRTGVDSGGVTPAHAAGPSSSAREARLLECRLLVGAMLDDLPNFEDCYEELAVHYSVDVAIPDKFVGWLQRIGGRAMEVLEVLGVAEDSEDGDKGEMEMFQWMSPSSPACLNPAVQKIRQDSQAEESPSKRVS